MVLGPDIVGVAGPGGPTTSSNRWAAAPKPCIGAPVYVAAFWTPLNKHFVNSGPDLRTPPNQPGSGAPEPQDIVERPSDIAGCPAAKGKTLTLNLKRILKVSRVLGL